MNNIGNLQNSLCKIIKEVKVLKNFVIYIDFITYIFVILSFLGKLAALNLYLSSILNIIFLVILVAAFAYKKYENIALLFINNIIIYVFELFSAMLREYAFFNNEVLSDVIFRDSFFIFINIIFTIWILRQLKYKK